MRSIITIRRIDLDISGKKAIVFGGTSGIGLATCQALTKRGANVTAVSRNPDKANTDINGVNLVSVDARDSESVSKFFDNVGQIDILISTATGGSRAFGSFLEMDISAFKSSFDKLWGYSNVVRYGALKLSTNGCIVLVSGTPARKMRPGQVALSAVGGAVEALARAVAQEIVPKRINVVAPGIVDTPMVALTGKEREDHYKNITKAHLIKRAGKPQEIAQAIIFAVENEFISGTTIDVDGGWLLSQ